MSRRKIVLVGGGSVSWTPEIARDMMLQPELKEAEYVIHDPDEVASRLIVRILRQTANVLAPDAMISVQPQVARAFSDADAFLITISTGGLASMAYDISIPERFGIFHTVGDTSGPGGWARSLRNIPVFVKLAENFNRYAPLAPILNYTNPMTVLTDVLCRLCRGPVIGLCHGLFENLRFFEALYGIDMDKISARYAGLNHFFWMLDVRSSGIDLLTDLKKRLETRTLSELLKTVYRDPRGYVSNRDVADELWRQTGVLPYLGDRHTCEFLPYCINDRRLLRKYRLQRTSIAERNRQMEKRKKLLRRWLTTGLPSSQLKKSRETAADILGAWFSGKPFVDVGNVPNIGQIGNLPFGIVVETPVLVDHNGFSPVAMGNLPSTVLPFVQPWSHTFQDTVNAALSQDRKAALAALRLDPVVAHLDTASVKDLGQQLLKAHARATCYLK